MSRLFHGSLLAAVLSSPLVAGAIEPESIATPVYRSGDTWTFDRTHETSPNGFKQERIVETVSRLDGDGLLMGYQLVGSPSAPQELRLGPDLTAHLLENGAPVLGERMLAFPLKLGSTWTEDYVSHHVVGNQTSAHITMTSKVVGWEDVSTPAGTFHAVKIEGQGKIVAQMSLPAVATSMGSASAFGSTAMSHAQRAVNGTMTVTTFRQVYYAPEARMYVKSVFEHYDDQGVRTSRDTNMLATYKLAP